MTDGNSNHVSRIQRPTRIRIKTRDDNVLGILWKEERELRKAMYVSLRGEQLGQGQQIQSLSPHRLKDGKPRGELQLRSRIPNPTTSPSAPTSPRVSAYPLRWRHQRVSAVHIVSESKLRSAKLRATARLSVGSVRRRFATKPNGASEKNEQSLMEKNTRTSRVAGRLKSPSFTNGSPISPSSSNSPDRSISKNGRSRVSSPSTNLTLSSNSRTLGRSVPATSINRRVGACVKFPHVHPHRGRLASRTQSTSANHRRPAVISIEESGKKKRSALQTAATQLRSDIKLDSNADENNSTSIPSCRESEERRSVSVHDFVEFICYQGTSCLESRLESFRQPFLTHESSITTRTSQTSAASRSLDTNLPNRHATVQYQLPNSPKRTATTTITTNDHHLQANNSSIHSPIPSQSSSPRQTPIKTLLPSSPSSLLNVSLVAKKLAPAPSPPYMVNQFATTDDEDMAVDEPFSSPRVVGKIIKKRNKTIVRSKGREPIGCIRRVPLRSQRR